MIKLTDPTAAVNALLDNNQAELTRIAEAKTRALKAALGERCPECGSANCASDEEQGHCDACDAHWYCDLI